MTIDFFFLSLSFVKLNIGKKSESYQIQIYLKAIEINTDVILIIIDIGDDAHHQFLIIPVFWGKVHHILYMDTRSYWIC